MATKRKYRSGDFVEFLSHPLGIVIRGVVIGYDNSARGYEILTTKRKVYLAKVQDIYLYEPCGYTKQELLVATLRLLNTYRKHD